MTALGQAPDSSRATEFPLVPPPPWDHAGGSGELPSPPPPSRQRFVPWTAGVALLAVLVIYATDIGLGVVLWPLAGEAYYTFGSLVVVVAGCRVLANLHGPTAWRALLGRRPRWSDVLVGLAGAVAVIVADLMLSVAVGLWWPAGLGDAQDWIGDAVAATPVLAVVGLVLTGPVAEELLFRGVLFQGLRRRFRLGGALLVSTAAFAIVHPMDLSPSSIVLMVSVGMGGLVFAGLLEWRGTLVAPIVAHIAVNAWATFAMAGGPVGVPVGPGQAVEAFPVDVGECIQGFPDEQHEAGAEPTVWTPLPSCDEPHSMEVYLREPVGQADAYPGEEDAAWAADERCLASFEAYVGTSYWTSELDFVSLWPTEAAWEEGDRDLRCALVPMDRGSTTGSARGSGR